MAEYGWPHNGSVHVHSKAFHAIDSDTAALFRTSFGALASGDESVLGRELPPSHLAPASRAERLQLLTSGDWEAQYLMHGFKSELLDSVRSEHFSNKAADHE